MASLAGCNELSGTEENTGETVLDRTLTTSDGNPATVSFEASSASALSLEVSSNEAAVVDMFDPATGTSLGTVGEGIAVENSGRVESAAVPESTDTLTLGAAMHPDARVDVTVTDKGNGGTGEPTPVPEQVNAVRSALEETDSDRVPLVGPLWASLFAHQRERGVEIADEALDSLHAAVYGSIANQEASAWADSSIEQIASILTTATVTAVAAKTGLPAGLIEGALRDEIENVLQGENVNWSFDSATPRQLDATGGSLTVDTTLSLDLSVRNTGVTIEAPFRLEATVDGETAPASASIDDFSVLTDEVTIEDVS
jgi:hypothetical protein